MNKTSYAVPNWFWVIAVLLLLWNVLGIVAFFNQMNMSEADFQQIPENQREFMKEMLENYPSWTSAAFAISVFSAAIGWILMLLRKKTARSLFILSFIAILIQMVYTGPYIGKAIAEFGAGQGVMPLLIIVLALFAIWFSGKSITRNWIS